MESDKLKRIVEILLSGEDYTVNDWNEINALIPELPSIEKNLAFIQIIKQGDIKDFDQVMEDAEEEMEETVSLNNLVSDVLGDVDTDWFDLEPIDYYPDSDNYSVY